MFCLDLTKQTASYSGHLFKVISGRYFGAATHGKERWSEHFNTYYYKEREDLLVLLSIYWLSEVTKYMECKKAGLGKTVYMGFL